MRFLITLLICFNFFALNGQVKLKTLGKLPEKLRESSGLIYENANSLWTHNDGGNSTELYNIDSTGKIIRKIKVKGTKNYDWEACFLSEKGHLYIGDIGNNLNTRKHLKIYRIKFSKLLNGEDYSTKKIEFKYKGQDEFPPKKDKRYYDCEAFVVANDSIYLITKNRTSSFDGKIKIYGMKAKPGEHTARHIKTYRTKGKNMLYWWVTDATLVGNDLILLSSNKLFCIKDFIKSPSKRHPFYIYKLSNFSQKEGLCTDKNGHIYITDERFGPLGGKLYKARISFK